MKYKLINENFTEDYGANILKSRGVEDVDIFCNPTENQLESPWLLDNMDFAVALFDKTINLENPKILLLVDCDCDGFTSSAIIHNYIKSVWNWNNVTIDYLIHDGKQHGLSDKIDWIMDNGINYNLLIVPDAGSNDFEYIERLKEINLKVLILDHHLIEGEVSDNCVLVNNQASSEYKNKALSGAGVAFQFCRALDEYYGIENAYNFIDLAALGIDGDMMSALEPENQYIWKYGFSHINNWFFKVLCDKQDFSMGGKINPISVAFYIVPLINAMIRVGTQEEKERLFLAFIDGHRKVVSNKRGAHGALEEVAIESARECTNAKSHQDKDKKEISENLEVKIFNDDLLSNKILMICLEDDDNFSSEMNGLIAMQCTQKYHRPTIIARINKEGYARGSARGLNQSSISSFKDFLQESGLFEYTIGHDNAFGISIKKSDIEAFHKYANEKLADLDLSENVYEVELERRAVDKDIKSIIFDLERYENCWGQGNSAPLIAITDLIIRKNDIQIMGKTKNTLKFEKNGITYIKFFADKEIEDLQKYDEVSIKLVGKANVNEWMGHTTGQIQIQDMEYVDSKLAF